MLNEFSLSRGRAMINFTLKYCDTSEKLLDSYGFRKVVEVFVRKLKKEEGLIYNFYLDVCMLVRRLSRTLPPCGPIYYFLK